MGEETWDCRIMTGWMMMIRSCTALWRTTRHGARRSWVSFSCWIGFLSTVKKFKQLLTVNVFWSCGISAHRHRVCLIRCMMVGRLRRQMANWTSCQSSWFLCIFYYISRGFSLILSAKEWWIWIESFLKILWLWSWQTESIFSEWVFIQRMTSRLVNFIQKVLSRGCQRVEPRHSNSLVNDKILRRDTKISNKNHYIFTISYNIFQYTCSIKKCRILSGPKTKCGTSEHCVHWVSVSQLNTYMKTWTKAWTNMKIKFFNALYA